MTERATDIALLQQGMDYLKKEIAEIKSMIKEHTIEEKDRYETIANSKANKWVETAVAIAITGIVSAAAGLVWYVVTQKI